MKPVKILPAAIFCLIFSFGRSGNALSHGDALGRLQRAGISVTSSGGCSNKNNPQCTSLEGIRDNTINSLIILRRASGCPIIVTGGTETGHGNTGTHAHYNGHKVDVGLNPCLQNYVTRNFKNIGIRGDGAAQWKSGAGNIYAREGNHWDITYF